MGKSTISMAMASIDFLYVYQAGYTKMVELSPRLHSPLAGMILQVSSGKHTKNHGKIHHFKKGKINELSMAMFNSYVSYYQRVKTFYQFPLYYILSTIPVLWYIIPSTSQVHVSRC